MPLVTLITPTYNQGEFIRQCIDSVLAQTYRNFEYIIIDALSKDETSQILNEYSNKITRIIREPDGGQSDAIIKGFRLAKGELVGWINSDDMLYPDALDRVVAAYRENPQAKLFYNSSLDIISRDGTWVCRQIAKVHSHDYLLRKCVTALQPGSFYPKNALIEVGYFDVNLKYSMDLDLWLRLLRVGTAFDVGGEPTASYRCWDGTKTSTGNIDLLSERISMLRKHGLRVFDRTFLSIMMSILKLKTKRTPIIGSLAKKVFYRFKPFFSRRHI
jgi:glycosyltransferase involved in cell wall biosynthesis